MTSVDKERKSYSFKDYKKIRILNYLYSNRPEHYLKYTLCNLPSSTGIKYQDIDKILEDLVNDDLIEKKREPKSKSYGITKKGTVYRRF